MGLLTTFIAALSIDYLQLHPLYTFTILKLEDQIGWLTLIIMGISISLVAKSVYQARTHAHPETALDAQLKTITLASINDAIITTDIAGGITLLNTKAEQLTGWTNQQAQGKPLAQVFKVIKEETREPIADPFQLILNDGRIGSLTDQMLLIDRQGRELSIENSAALIKPVDEKCYGVVLIFRDCSEKRKHQEILKENILLKERLSKIAESTPGALFSYLLLPDGSISIPYGSPTMEDLFGIKLSELNKDASKIFKLMNADDAQQAKERILVSAKTMSVWQNEFRIQHPFKGERWLAGRSTPVMEADKSIIWHGFVQDITERKQKERALHLLADAFENCAHGIAMGLPETNMILICNPAFANMLGSTVNEISNTPILSIYHPDDKEKVKGFIAQSDLKGKVQYEVRMKRKDGSTFPVQMDLVSVYDENRNLLYRIATMQDLTERKRTQEQLQRFVSLSPAVLYALKIRDGIYEPSWTSDNICSFTGYNVAEASEQDWWSNHVHPEDLERVLASNTNLLNREQILVQYRFRKKDNSYLWVQDEKRLLRDAQGNPSEVIGAWTDITERVQLEENFRQVQKLEAIGQLSGGIAHDFNNILSIIQGHISLLELRNLIYPHIRESISEIKEASARAANLTSQLLMFSRRQALQLRKADLNEIVTHMNKMLQRILGEDIEMCLHCTNQLLPIYADVSMIEQIVLNLAVNSRDAMPQGGTLTITTSAVTFPDSSLSLSLKGRSGNFACLTVTDSGCGISSEDMKKVFEPFFTTKEVGKGTGLGLATVFGIVQQHQGWIDLSSEVNQGTSFQIYLPLLIEDKPEFAEPVCPKIDNKGHETILIVEDEPALLMVVSIYLADLGYSILEAANGVEAMKIWDQNSSEIKLVITDLVMPGGISGIELAKNLHQKNAQLKFIFTSGYSKEMASKNMLLKEKDSFLTKPYNPDHLAQEIRFCLDH